jgi:hypothetical protein
MKTRNLAVIGLGSMETPIAPLRLKGGYKVGGYDILAKHSRGLPSYYFKSVAHLPSELFIKKRGTTLMKSPGKNLLALISPEIPNSLATS